MIADEPNEGRAWFGMIVDEPNEGRAWFGMVADELNEGRAWFGIKKMMRGQGRAWLGMVWVRREKARAGWGWNENTGGLCGGGVGGFTLVGKVETLLELMRVFRRVVSRGCPPKKVSANEDVP
jgi:hypothetical protein